MNIVYFVVHDLGKHAGCYGAPVATPNIDAFAAESLRFEHAFCSSAACTPSRCCAMTGLYAHGSGGVGLAHMGWPLPAEVETVVDYLGRAGYETIHAGMEHERHPGQNRYAVDLQETWDDFNTQQGVEKALDYLKRRDRAQPFYLNIGSQQPHASTWQHAEKLHGGRVAPDDVYIPLFVADGPAARAAFGDFEAAIRYMDQWFGRFLQGLKELGHDRDTLVVFTTDHGIAAPRAKGTLYDRGTEIALLVRAPDRRFAGAACQHLIQNIDFAPTLVEAAGAEPPAHLHGRSFWPIFDGRDYRPHEALFSERNFHGEHRLHGKEGDYVDRYDPIRAIRTRDFHYIRHFDPAIRPRAWLPWEIEAMGQRDDQPWPACYPAAREPRPEVELYHVRHDPLEFVNVAGRPEFRTVETELSANLQRWMEETDDFVLRSEVPSRREAPGWGGWPGK